MKRCMLLNTRGPQGATRFCMGAAWRDVPQGMEFEQVLEMVRGVRALGMKLAARWACLMMNKRRRSRRRA